MFFTERTKQIAIFDDSYPGILIPFDVSFFFDASEFSGIALNSSSRILLLCSGIASLLRTSSSHRTEDLR